MPGTVFTDSYCMGQKSRAGLIFDIYRNKTQSKKQGALRTAKIGNLSLQADRQHQKTL